MNKPKNISADNLPRYRVEVYNGKYLLQVVVVQAKDVEAASIKARSEFFENIRARGKRAYN